MEDRPGEQIVVTVDRNDEPTALTATLAMVMKYFGDKPKRAGAPAGDLVFDVELLEIR